MEVVIIAVIALDLLQQDGVRHHDLSGIVGDGDRDLRAGRPNGGQPLPGAAGLDEIIRSWILIDPTPAQQLCALPNLIMRIPGPVPTVSHPGGRHAIGRPGRQARKGPTRGVFAGTGIAVTILPVVTGRVDSQPNRLFIKHGIRIILGDWGIDVQVVTPSQQVVHPVRVQQQRVPCDTVLIHKRGILPSDQVGPSDILPPADLPGTSCVEEIPVAVEVVLAVRGHRDSVCAVDPQDVVADTQCRGLILDHNPVSLLLIDGVVQHGAAVPGPVDHDAVHCVVVNDVVGNVAGEVPVAVPPCADPGAVGVHTIAQDL